MIISSLFYILGTILNAVISVLPELSLPSVISDAFNFFAEVSHFFDKLFPVNDMLIVMTLFLSFETAILLYKFINWIVNKIRGGGYS